MRVLCFLGLHCWCGLGSKVEPFPGSVVVRMECCGRKGCPAVRYRMVPRPAPYGMGEYWDAYTAVTAILPPAPKDGEER